MVDAETETNVCDKEKQGVEAFRLLNEDDPELKYLECEDEYLLRFLYACRFNVESAFKRLKRFYEMLMDHPDWFSRVGPLAKKEVIQMNSRIMTNKTDKKGRVIFIVKIENAHPDNMTLMDQAQMDDIMMEYIVSNDIRARNNGITLIIDAKNIPWSVVTWLTPDNISTAIKKVDCCPLKINKIHVVNQSMLFNILLKIVWPFLPSKMKDTVIFHSDDWDELHEYIDPEVLPPEYGGTGSLDIDECHEQLFAKDEEIFRSLQTNRYSFIEKIMQDE